VPLAVRRPRSGRTLRDPAGRTRAAPRSRAARPPKSPPDRGPPPLIERQGRHTLAIVSRGAATFACLGLLASAPLATAAAEPAGEPPRRAADLTLHLGAAGLHDAGIQAVREARYGSHHRSELFVLALERAHVEPLATVAWAFVATGLRLDWSPPVFDGGNADARGWGSLMLRLRVRIDATNHLVFPRHPDGGRAQRPARRSST
jgi:hypothetical protein